MAMPRWMWRVGAQEVQLSRLLDDIHRAVRTRGMSDRTGGLYAAWVRRFVLFHGKRHPRDLQAEHANAFLEWLANERKVSASTQNQARAALVFLYSEVLSTPLQGVQLVRARDSRKRPIVLTREEVRAVLSQLQGEYRLIGSILYGSGLRLLECLQLRVKD